MCYEGAVCPPLRPIKRHHRAVRRDVVYVVQPALGDLQGRVRGVWCPEEEQRRVWRGRWPAVRTRWGGGEFASGGVAGGSRMVCLLCLLRIPRAVRFDRAEHTLGEDLVRIVVVAAAPARERPEHQTPSVFHVCWVFAAATAAAVAVDRHLAGATAQRAAVQRAGPLAVPQIHHGTEHAGTVRAAVAG